MTRRRALEILVLAACLGALAFTVWSLDPRRVLEAAKGAHPSWLVLSVLLVVARFLLWGAKWTNMLRREGEVGYVPALQAIMAGSFVNLTTPTAKMGGGVLRAVLISRLTGWRLSTSYGWALADQISNLLAYLLLAGSCALLAGLSRPAGFDQRPYLLAGSGALVLLLLLLLLRNPAWRIARHPRPARWLARIMPKRFVVDGPQGRSTPWLEPMLRPTLQVGSTWRIAPIDLGLGALSWGSMCVANALAIRALGVEASVPSVAVALIVASVVGTVSPGGVGATEAFLIAILISMGIPGDIAAAGALLHRATYYIVILVWGGIALVQTRRLLGEQRGAA